MLAWSPPSVTQIFCAFSRLQKGSSVPNYHRRPPHPPFIFFTFLIFTAPTAQIHLWCVIFQEALQVGEPSVPVPKKQRLAPLGFFPFHRTLQGNYNTLLCQCLTVPWSRGRQQRKRSSWCRHQPRRIERLRDSSSTLLAPNALESLTQM